MNELIEKINNEYKLSGCPEQCIITSNVDETDMKLLNARCKKKGLELALTNRWKDYYTIKINNGEYDEILTDLKEANEYIEQNAEGKFIKTDMMYITIRPDEKRSSLPLLVKKMEKVVKKVWIKNYLYVFEQTGMNDEEIGKGYHCHLLLHHDSDKKKWSEFKNEIANTFNNMLEAKVGLDYKNCLKQQAYLNFSNYLLGKKDTKKLGKETKAIKQQYDIPFREINNLKPFYTNNFDFFENYTLI